MGRPARGPLTSYCSLSIADPTGKEGPARWMLFYYPRRRKKGFSPPMATVQPMRGSQDSANEKPRYFQGPVYTNRCFAYNSTPAFPLSLIKEPYSLFPGLPVVLLGLAPAGSQFSVIST